MSNLSVTMKAEPLRSTAFGSVGTGYSALGTALVNPPRIYHIQNLTDANILVSYDGSTDNEAVAAGGFLLLDITSNMSRSEGFYFPKGMTTYIKREAGAPTTGNVYLSVYYGTVGSD